jgi:F-type H+-transporting ATPase subunit delta
VIAESVYARAFARALLGAAQARRDVERVAEDMAAIEGQWAGSAELRRVCSGRLRSLTGKASGLIGEIWGDTLSETSRAFLERLLDLGQLRLLPQVAARFRELADRAAGRRHVEAAFACEPRPAELERVRQLVADAYGPPFELSVRVEPELLAGLRLRIDDRLVDASLAGRLSRLKHALLKPMRPEAAATGGNTQTL